MNHQPARPNQYVVDVRTHLFMVLLFNKTVLFYDSFEFQKEVLNIRRYMSMFVEINAPRSKRARTGFVQSEIRVLLLDTRQFGEFVRLQCDWIYPEHRVQWEEREDETGEWYWRLINYPDLCWQPKTLPWPKPC